MLSIPDSNVRPPYIFLILGAISFFVGVISTYTGETWARFGHIVYRAKEPSEFWWIVAIYYVGGVCFIGYFLYRVIGLSN
jgi:hypothetical protein